MVKMKAKFTFPTELVTEPVIYSLGKNFDVITNIRRADVTATQGWVILELEGEEDQINRGLAWVSESGVRVDPIVGDIVEG